MERRSFLKYFGTGAGLSFLPNLSANTTQSVQKMAGGKKLLVIFQRGGNDSLNTMVPVESTQFNLYKGLRPRVSINLGDLVSIPGDSFFRLHPGLNSLVPVIQSGTMSFIHAVGYPGADRSHFESQSYYETAVPGSNLLSGWLNRYLAATTGPGLIRGISIGYNIPQSTSGTIPVPISNNFGNSTIAMDQRLSATQEEDYKELLKQTYDLTPSLGNDEVYGTGQKLFQMIESFASRNANDYVPENGAVYPTGGFGNRLMHAAQMLKETPNFLGIEIVTLDQTGYDTHSRQVQPGNTASQNSGHGYLMRQLGDGLSAFYTDLGSAMTDVLVMVISEFGRRAYDNDSFGTDHGTGAIVTLMGGAGFSSPTLGGNGMWPGLEQGSLKDGGDLDWVFDYRDIYWEVLANHMGVGQTALESIIPGHTYTPLGLI